MRMLTTGECATILNIAFDAPEGYTAAFMLAEVDAARLHARVHDQRRSRRRVRIHPEDFAVYLRRHYATIAERALKNPLMADQAA